MTKRKIVGSLMLLLTAFIWGCAFVAQSSGMEYVGPFTFNCVRFIIGAIVLIPVILINDKIKQRSPDYHKPTKAENLYLLKTGIACGTALGIASVVQQCGIMYTSVGKAGFITALYIIIVPVLSLFFHKKPGKMLWLCVGLSLVGLCLLTLSDVSGINKGDVLALISAFLFAVQIIIIERMAGDVDGVKLSSLQFAVAGIVAGILMLLFEKVTFEALWGARIEILYTGVLSCGIAYTFQIIGQQRIESTVASMIMSLECVFAALMGALILHQTLTVRELAGCALMLIAIFAAQLFLNEKE